MLLICDRPGSTALTWTSTVWDSQGLTGRCLSVEAWPRNSTGRECPCRLGLGVQHPVFGVAEGRSTFQFLVTLSCFFSIFLVVCCSSVANIYPRVLSLGHFLSFTAGITVPCSRVMAEFPVLLPGAFLMHPYSSRHTGPPFQLAHMSPRHTQLDVLPVSLDSSVPIGKGSVLS